MEEHFTAIYGNYGKNIQVLFTLLTNTSQLQSPARWDWHNLKYMNDRPVCEFASKNDEGPMLKTSALSSLLIVAKVPHQQSFKKKDSTQFYMLRLHPTLLCNEITARDCERKCCKFTQDL